MQYLKTLERPARNVPEHEGTRPRNDVTPRMFRTVPLALVPLPRNAKANDKAIWPAFRTGSGYATAVVIYRSAPKRYGNETER